MEKVKPLYDVLNFELTHFSLVHEELSIDESMVPYYGFYSSKQFIFAKPIHFVYKLLVPTISTGFSYNSTIYERRTDSSTDKPFGTRVAKHALSVCQNLYSHQVFFDYFFSSYQLLIDPDEKCF